MSFALSFHYILLNMFRMLIHPCSGICDYLDRASSWYLNNGRPTWWRLLYHVNLLLNMFRILIHPSSGACDLFVELFHALYSSGLMCVGVTLWFGWGGVVWYPDAVPMLIHPSSGACDLFVELFHGLYCSGWSTASGYHTTPAKPQRNTNSHRTRAIQPMK